MSASDTNTEFQSFLVSMLIGQSGAEAQLARALAQERVGHAYLFLGPAGSGKATAARLFAQAVSCARQPATQRSDEGWRLHPCGECESCRRAVAGTHPEILEIYPDSKTGQDISVEQARLIRQNAALRPKIGSRRVYLLPNAEALNEVSGNALLKTLEEPSPTVTLVLCAPNPSQVLPTIRSRCQLVRFGLAPVDEIAAALAARGAAEEIAWDLARACGGRPGLAFTWLTDASVLERRHAVLDLFLKAISTQSQAKADPGMGILSLRLAEQLRGLVAADRDADEGPSRPAKVLHSENLEIGLGLLRDLLLLTQGAPPELSQNQSRVSQLIELAARADTQRVLADIEAVREAQQLLDRNVNPQLVLERLFWGLISGAFPVRNRLFEEVA